MNQKLLICFVIILLIVPLGMALFNKPILIMQNKPSQDINYQLVNDVNNANFLNGIPGSGYIRTNGSSTTTAPIIFDYGLCFGDSTCMTTAVSGLPADFNQQYVSWIDGNATFVKKTDYNSLGDQRYQNIDSTLEDFLTGAGAVVLWFPLSSTASGATHSVSTTLPNGVYQVGSTGTSASDNIGKTAQTNPTLNATAAFEITFRAKIDNNTSILSRFGTGANATADSNNGMFFRFDTDRADKNWQIIVGDSDSYEIHDTNREADQYFHLFKITVSSAKIEFFIDGTSVGSTTDATNIQTSQLGIVTQSWARSPSTAARLLIDYWDLKLLARQAT